MSKKILLVIDPQFGFLEGGKLGVEGATDIMNNLCEHIRTNGLNEYEAVIATVDWHPIDHCSFKENGGIWPLHCTQHSHDAAIYEPLLNILNEKAKSFAILTKGTDPDHEEYSIFKNKKSHDYIVDLVKNLGVEEIDVLGIAYGYCVADSVRDGLRAIPNAKFNVIKRFCPAIKDESIEKFNKFIENTERVCLVEE